MAKSSLYEICLKRVLGLLKMGTRKHCSMNQFSNLPSKIIDDLMVLLEDDDPSVSLALPLLTSGSLTRLQLNGCKFQEEHDLFVEAIQTNCFRLVRVLTCFSVKDSSFSLIELMISSCPKLEEFHLSKFKVRIINLDIFKNSKELRVLRISVPTNRLALRMSLINLPVLASLRNLQVVCFSKFMNSDMIADVLQHCPWLISLGCVDSLKGLKKVHANIERKGEIGQEEASKLFHLKKCVWGKSVEEFNRMEHTNVTSYKSSFPEKIKAAVSLCPFVEELVVNVSNIDSLESLKNLEQLTCLSITFVECDEYYITHFMDLLTIIGPKLKYLSVNSGENIPVDIVLGCCPQLESLEIMMIATVSEFAQSQNILSLKKLRVRIIDPKALTFLLSSCVNLVEFAVAHGLCLDDNALEQILTVNPLIHLKICDINLCRLSVRGYRMLLEKAVSLERVKFATFQLEIASIVENLINELNLTNLTYGEMDMPYKKLGMDF